MSGPDFAERLAYGLFVMSCPLCENPRPDWEALDEITRESYLAEARFVLAIALVTPEDPDETV